MEHTDSEFYVSDDWVEVTRVTYQDLLDALETISSKYETKEAHMDEIKRVRIEFNLSPAAYRYDHPVAKALQALYTAVVEDVGSYDAACWEEHEVYNGEEGA